MTNQARSLVVHGWAIKWREDNKLDGRTEYLMGRYGAIVPDVPPALQAYKTMVFRTRQIARDFIAEHYSYIREREDLRKEPFGWKMPVPVKVSIEVQEL